MSEDHEHSGRSGNGKKRVPASSGSDDQRRSTIKALLAGGAVAGVTLPDKWRTPIVQAVVLPAHAQTTGGPPTDDDPPLLAECDAGLIAVVAAPGGGEPGSELTVEGTAFISAGCIPEDEGSRTWDCTLIHEGNTLTPDSITSIDSCEGSIPLTNGCLVSCSVFVSWISQEVDGGDSITMAFSFGGECVCSGVTTVVESG